MDGVHHLVFRRSDTLLPGRGRKHKDGLRELEHIPTVQTPYSP